jgi:hypothetical protein
MAPGRTSSASISKNPNLGNRAMPTQRAVDLCLEASDRAAEVVALLDEFVAAANSGGAGIRRDPTNILGELREEAFDLLATVREARDELEHTGRGVGG